MTTESREGVSFSLSVGKTYLYVLEVSTKGIEKVIEIIGKVRLWKKWEETTIVIVLGGWIWMRASIDVFILGSSARKMEFLSDVFCLLGEAVDKVLWQEGVDGNWGSGESLE